MAELNIHVLSSYTTYSGAQYQALSTSYEVFGPALHSAPIVLVHHALTGNSDVMSPERGWWKEIVGKGKLIDTNKYTVIAFNIVGNGYDDYLIERYKDFTTKDIARIFFEVLENLKVQQVYAIIGGSLGGGIAWEMACLSPRFAQFIIPIAADWKSTDWIIGHNAVQESILLNSSKPLEDARKMAMLFYRTPQSFTQKFERSKTADGQLYNVTSWLNHHGHKLQNRFTVKAYLLMNHLLTTINIVNEGQNLEEVLAPIESTIIQIGVNSDLFFIPSENVKTKKILDRLKIPNAYHEIQSLDGHDAFLIEFEQLTRFLSKIFKG